jgi:hypothetical protein
MKTQLARALLVLAAACALAVTPLQAHANRCSQASGAGSWAYTYHRNHLYNKWPTAGSLNGPFQAGCGGESHR